VYLIDEMHVGLNKVLSVEDQRPTPAPVTTVAQLKHFAREAEVNGSFEQAARFYQEVCVYLCVWLGNVVVVDDTIAAYRQTHSPSEVAWSEGRRPLGAVP